MGIRHALCSSAALLVAPLAAQCAPQWSVAGEALLPDTEITCAVRWDPDGGGPEPEHVVCGGGWIAHSGGGGYLKIFDPTRRSWWSLPALPARVRALAVDATGRLLAAGGNGTAGFLQRWDGQAWRSLGPAGLAEVTAMALLDTGDVVVAERAIGAFQPAPLQRWDGTAWTPFGLAGGTMGGYVTALRPMAGGACLAAGYFDNLSGTAVTGVALLTAAGWAPFGTPLLVSGPFVAVDHAWVLPNQEVVLSGAFRAPGGAADFVRWNGAVWVAMDPSGAVRNVTDLASLPNGELLAVGALQLPGGAPGAADVARFDGLTWSRLAGGVSLAGGLPMVIVPLPNQTLVAGTFATVQDVRADGAAVFDGVAWSATTTGANGPVHAFAELPDGSLLLAGAFSGIGGKRAPGVARWDGTAFHALGAGCNGPVHAVHVAPSGDLFVGGTFAMAGGQPAAGIARWDGQQWHALGAGATAVTAIATMAGGDLVVAGDFRQPGNVLQHPVARWNGSAWTALGSGVPRAPWALQVLANGDLVASGQLGTLTPTGLLRWDGQQWLPLDTGVDFAGALLQTRDGSLLAFVRPMTLPITVYEPLVVARLQGSAWVPLGPAPTGGVAALQELPDGDLLAGGAVTAWGTAAAAGLARWSSTQWSALAQGVGGQLTGGAAVGIRALHLRADGELWLGGNFATAAGLPSAGFARLIPPCPAAVGSTATSCVGPAGPLHLLATQQPWVGSTFRSVATGFAPGACGLAVVGFTPANLPLLSVHPAGVSGCTLAASTEALTLLLPTQGAAELAFPVPHDPGLVGVVLYHQVLQAELAGSGALQSLSSSNRLQLVTGLW